MTVQQFISLATAWFKRVVSVLFLLIIAVLLLEAVASAFGLPFRVKTPGWSQNTALMIAALAYATGRA